jgi:putative copper export protein
VDLPSTEWVQDEDSAPLVDAGTLSRWLTYLAIMLMVGSVTFGAITRRAFRRSGTPSDELEAWYRRAGLRWGLIGSVMFLLAATGRLYAQVVAFLFPGDPLTLADFGTIVFDTGWGERWLIQVGAGLSAAVGFALARRGVPVGGPLAVIGAIATAVTLPLTGHALAASWHWSITWPLQALHVLAGATWLGSLLLLVLVVFGAGADAERRERTVADLIAVFSPVAMVGVAGAVVMGTVLSVSYVGSWAGLWQTAYGRTLLIKIGLLGLTALLGAYNWRRLRPRLGTPGSAGRLFQSARLELLVGALLLVATAILVALPAPHV